MHRYLLLGLALTGCTKGLVDYDFTGIAVAPGPGAWTAPVKLMVVNRTENDVICEITQHEGCPELASIDAITHMAPKARWSQEGVDCALIDVICMADTPERDTTEALRAWSWEILPDEDTATPVPVPTP